MQCVTVMIMSVQPKTCTGTADVIGSPPTFPNIGYLGGSYNIFKGNPQSTHGLDPGFIGTGLFELTYRQNLTTADRNYSIPDHTTVNSAVSCSYAFSSNTIESITSYCSSLKVGVKADFGGFGASFAASADYETVRESASSATSTFISSHAKCEAYVASIDNAPLIKDFTDDVSNLPWPASDLDEYISFIEHWGTHTADAIRMGGLYGTRSEFHKSNYAKLVTSGIGVSAAAGYSGIVDVNAKFATDVERNAASQFNSLRSSSELYVVGGKPPESSDGTAFDWAQTVSKDPLPISYSLTALSKFLTPKYFPGDKNILNKQKAFENATIIHCHLTVSPEDAPLCDGSAPLEEPKLQVEFHRVHETWMIINHKTSDPELRALGTFYYKGNVTGAYSNPRPLIDSRKAPNDLITKELTWINECGKQQDTQLCFSRPVCPSGYSSVSEFASSAEFIPGLAPV